MFSIAAENRGQSKPAIASAGSAFHNLGVTTRKAYSQVTVKHSCKMRELQLPIFPWCRVCGLPPANLTPVCHLMRPVSLSAVSPLFTTISCYNMQRRTAFLPSTPLHTSQASNVQPKEYITLTKVFTKNTSVQGFEFFVCQHRSHCFCLFLIYLVLDLLNSRIYTDKINTAEDQRSSSKID